MAETLGSLCDKLTIIKLKQFHTDDNARLQSLGNQELQMKKEIQDYISDAINGLIPLEKLTFNANKVYKKEGNETSVISGTIGEIIAKLAETNCNLWHEQEKVYEFEMVAPDQKNEVVKNLAVLNLERNNCIDLIDTSFKELLLKKENE